MTVAEAWASTQPQRNPPPTKTVDNPLPSQRRRVRRLIITPQRTWGSVHTQRKRRRAQRLITPQRTWGSVHTQRKRRRVWRLIITPQRTWGSVHTQWERRRQKRKLPLTYVVFLWQWQLKFSRVLRFVHTAKEFAIKPNSNFCSYWWKATRIVLFVFVFAQCEQPLLAVLSVILLR